MGHNLILVKDYSIFAENQVVRFICFLEGRENPKQRWLMRRGELCCRGAPAGLSTRPLESVLGDTAGTGKSLNTAQEDLKKEIWDFCLLEIWDKDQMTEGKLTCTLRLLSIMNIKTLIKESEFLLE